MVGESGSGKTTLGKAILRLEKSNGAIEFEQNALHALAEKQLRPLRREMQIIFQDPYGSLNPRMSVEQILSEGLRFHKIGTRQSKSNSSLTRSKKSA